MRKINGQNVSGYNYFKTTPLEVFVGGYFSYKEKVHQNEENGKISLNPVSQGITGYTYNPSMFVISYNTNGKLDPSQNYQLKLGTAGTFGLACSYSLGLLPGAPTQATLLLSILPHLKNKKGELGIRKTCSFFHPAKRNSSYPNQKLCYLSFRRHQKATRPFH